MANAQFEHHGHLVTINVSHTGERWSWSYRIDDRAPVANIETGARTQEKALHEARCAAMLASRSRGEHDPLRRARRRLVAGESFARRLFCPRMCSVSNRR